MARSGRSGGSRPAARPAAKQAPAQQSRSASTQAGVPARTAPAGVPATQGQAQQKQPGMFAQMATTAAGVAVGSTMAHGLTSMLGFGGNSHSEVPQQSAPMQEQNFDERRMGGSCEAQAKDFTQCLNATGTDMTACAFYLDQLKSCQAMAAQY